MKKDTKINCDVSSCKHNVTNHCTLDNLDISCTCNTNECYSKKETICKSFSKK